MGNESVARLEVDDGGTLHASDDKGRGWSSLRLFQTTTIIGSPANATEAIIARFTLPSGLTVVSGAMLLGFTACTVAASGTAWRLRVRQTNVSGTVVADTGAIPQTGGANATLTLAGFDTLAAASMVYVLTSETPGAGAATTITQALLAAVIV